MRVDTYNRQRGRSLTRLEGEEYRQRHNHRSLNSSSPKHTTVAPFLPLTAQTPIDSGVVGVCSIHRSEKHRGGFRHRNRVNQGVFQSMFSSLVACNELLYDRCDECGDDDISYTYGKFSKNSATATTEEEESNTLDESTLDNSTILSSTLHALHADWETIGSGPIYGPIYRDLDETRSDIFGAATAERDWHHMYHTGDDAPRDLFPHDGLMHPYAPPPGTMLLADPAEGQNRSMSPKGGTLRDEHQDKKPVLCSSSKARSPRDQKPLSSLKRNRSNRSKGGGHVSGTRSRSRSLTRPRSLTRRSSHQRRTVRTTRSFCKDARGRLISERSKRAGRSRSSLREPYLITPNEKSVESKERARSTSSSREPSARRGKETIGMSKFSYTKSRDRSSRNPRSRTQKSARTRRSLSRGRSASQLSNVNRSVMSGFRGRSPQRQRNEEQNRNIAASTQDEASTQRSSTNVEHPLSQKEPSPGVNNFKVVPTSQTSTDEIESTEIKSGFLVDNINPEKQSKPQQKPLPGGKKLSFKGGFFPWRKFKGTGHERHSLDRKTEGQSRYDPIHVYDISTPTMPDDVPSKPTNENDERGLAFPVPNEEGQEIAIQDNEHCYEDPANVHSMLTMPSLDLHNMDDEMSYQGDEDDNKLVVVLTGNEDGTLVTDDGAP